MKTAFSTPFGSPEDDLTNAEFARLLGNTGVQEFYRDINLQALQDSLDCSLAFHGVALFFPTGRTHF